MEQTMTVNGRSYRIVRLLGKGKGGYSYLAEDEAGRYTLKQIHHDPCSYYQFGDKLAAELRDYERLRTAGVPMPELLAVDREQERILKEYVDGETVYDLVLRDALEPRLYEEMEALAARLQAQGLNIDYFPTNFLLREGRLVYVDYECNDYMEQWDFAHWGRNYWAKTPEFLACAAERGDLPAGEEEHP